jgi:hypothetical protein
MEELALISEIAVFSRHKTNMDDTGRHYNDNARGPYSVHVGDDFSTNKIDPSLPTDSPTRANMEQSTEIPLKILDLLDEWEEPERVQTVQTVSSAPLVLLLSKWFIVRNSRFLDDTVARLQRQGRYTVPSSLSFNGNILPIFDIFWSDLQSQVLHRVSSERLHSASTKTADGKGQWERHPQFWNAC